MDEVCDGAGEVDVAVGFLLGWGGGGGCGTLSCFHGSRCGRVLTNTKMLDVDMTRLKIRR